MVWSIRSRQSPTKQRRCQLAHPEAADVEYISNEYDLCQSQVREPVERVHVAAALLLARAYLCRNLFGFCIAMLLSKAVMQGVKDAGCLDGRNHLRRACHQLQDVFVRDSDVRTMDPSVERSSVPKRDRSGYLIQTSLTMTELMFKDSIVTATKRTMAS